MTMGPKAWTHSVIMKNDLESNHAKSHLIKAQWYSTMSGEKRLPMRLATIKVFNTPGFPVDKVSVSIQGNLLKKEQWWLSSPSAKWTKWIKMCGGSNNSDSVSYPYVGWGDSVRWKNSVKRWWKDRHNHLCLLPYPPKLYGQVTKKDPSSRLAI